VGFDMVYTGPLLPVRLGPAPGGSNAKCRLDVQPIPGLTPVLLPAKGSRACFPAFASQQKTCGSNARRRPTSDGILVRKCKGGATLEGIKLRWATSLPALRAVSSCA